MASEDPFPLDVVEGLVPALLRVYSLVHGVSYESGKPLDKPPTPQELVDATDDFKRKLQTARELLDRLPGGDLNAQNQDEVIQMLEQWRDLKREQLQRHFTEN
ncbi:hypothetical protein CPB86DRAFT_804892 [Serendipita vermifera]|nr:hypothetical protein CPB86DRAFT_804892 [Serendipita vermifera]